MIKPFEDCLLWLALGYRQCVTAWNVIEELAHINKSETQPVNLEMIFVLSENTLA